MEQIGRDFFRPTHTPHQFDEMSVRHGQLDLHQRSRLFDMTGLDKKSLGIDIFGKADSFRRIESVAQLNPFPVAGINLMTISHWFSPQSNSVKLN